MIDSRNRWATSESVYNCAVNAVTFDCKYGKIFHFVIMKLEINLPWLVLGIALIRIVDNLQQFFAAAIEVSLQFSMMLKRSSMGWLKCLQTFAELRWWMRKTFFVILTVFVLRYRFHCVTRVAVIALSQHRRHAFFSSAVEVNSKMSFNWVNEKMSFHRFQDLFAIKVLKLKSKKEFRDFAGPVREF